MRTNKGSPERSLHRQAPAKAKAGQASQMPPEGRRASNPFQLEYLASSTMLHPPSTSQAARSSAEILPSRCGIEGAGKKGPGMREGSTCQGRT